jgi:hypothetical protein
MAVDVVSNAIPLWVTVIGFAAPLFALAGSAVGYVFKQYLDAGEKRRSQFFELMKFLDSPSPIASKMAAVYELRKFPEHKDFIIRFCDSQQGNITGTGAQILAAEFKQTRDFMAAK